MTGPGQAALVILGMAAALGLSVALAWWRGVVVARREEAAQFAVDAEGMRWVMRRRFPVRCDGNGPKRLNAGFVQWRAIDRDTENVRWQVLAERVKR